MKNNKLPFWRVALYSSASAGLNILAITVSTWLLYFYAPPPDSGRPVYLPAVTDGRAAAHRHLLGCGHRSVHRPLVR